MALVLHGHLPFVRHPERERHLEEDWFFEALFETYLPLFEMLERLEQEGIPAPLTLSLSPTLLSMMKDPLLQRRALAHVDRLLGLLEKEEVRVRSCPEFQSVVGMYLSRLTRLRDLFVRRYRMDLVPAVRGLAARERLEVITTAATHGFFPILGLVEPTVQAQVRTALRLFRDVFGHRSPGFWLPECGFQSGHETILARERLGYFLVDSHGLLHAKPEPKFGTFAPVRCSPGLHVFGRDMESSKQVWSSTEGYPGDYDYREFYRDVGFDLDAGYLRPCLPEDGTRQFTGLKYYRITGPGTHKEPYQPEAGRRKADLHAQDFLGCRVRQAALVAPTMDRPPLMTCMYDAELFGHWWFEGLDFLESFFRHAAARRDIELVTPSGYLQRHPSNQAAMPATSTWGERGYSEYWLNRSNDWIYRHLLEAGERMVGLAERIPAAKGLTRRALNQAARELMLAQASDWAFMMKTGSHASYAVNRTETHLAAFQHLQEQVGFGTVDAAILKGLEDRTPLFPDIDYRDFCPVKSAGPRRGKGRKR